MSSIPANALGLLQLSVLLLSCITVFGDELDVVSWAVSPAHPHHAPTYAPVESPKHPKAFPPSHHHHHKAPTPSHSPVKPPTPSHRPPFTRKVVAVQGVVFCKSCKASPIVGAVVKLQCKNTKFRPVVQTTTTGKDGYFFIMARRTSTFGSHKCKVSLVSSPLVTCNKPTNLNGGIVGAVLKNLVRPRGPLPFELYQVGPFAFESSSQKCPP